MGSVGNDKYRQSDSFWAICVVLKVLQMYKNSSALTFIIILQNRQDMVWATLRMTTVTPRLGTLITVILPLSLDIWGPHRALGGESFSPNYFWATFTDGTMIMFKIWVDMLFCVQDGRLTYPCIRTKFFNRVCEEYVFPPLKGKKRDLPQATTYKEVCWWRKDTQN